MSDLSDLFSYHGFPDCHNQLTQVQNSILSSPFSFGKYRDKPIAKVISDSKYLDWLEGTEFWRSHYIRRALIKSELLEEDGQVNPHFRVPLSRLVKQFEEKKRKEEREKQEKEEREQASNTSLPASNASSCLICLDPMTSLVRFTTIPCGHACLCQSCGETIIKSTQKMRSFSMCPLCKRNVQGIYKSYL
jgi:hypothetical protein